jgi:protocatechuate 3,4-dioxygenase beta subunit
VRYGPRPRHIHFKVTPPAGSALVTQLYFEDRVAATADAFDRSRRDPRVSPLVPKAGAEPGALEARFDIVLRTG